MAMGTWTLRESTCSGGVGVREDEVRTVTIKALACDVDATLAEDDLIGPKMREMLERARQADVRLILVTGRTFFELMRGCDCLPLFDAVVAEHGAVVYYPTAAMIRDHALPIPGRLTAELDGRGIPYQVGRVTIAVAQGDESALREVLADAGITREVVRERARVTLVPVGVSKGAAIQEVLRSLNLSPHNVLAIGHAESDLSFLDACQFTACPGDSADAVRQRVDWILPGSHGDGIATAIGDILLGRRCPAARSDRERIALGWVVATGEPLSLPARGINVLVHGDSHSGKSWLAGALVERLVSARYAVCVIDPEGDYGVLARLPGMASVQIGTLDDVDHALAPLVDDPARSVILDLSNAAHASKLSLVDRALHVTRDMRRRLARPHWIVVDEAHYAFRSDGVDADALDLGRGGICLVTYRLAQLADEIVSAMDVFILARTTAPSELPGLRTVLSSVDGVTETVVDALGRLPHGEFVMVRRDSPRRASVLTFVAAPRQALHVRHRAKYVESIVPPGREFLFRRPDGQIGGAAESLQSFRRVVAIAPDEVLAHHARLGDFSRWVEDVFQDTELARQLRKAEGRWRRGELPELRHVIDALITVRYGVDGRG